MLRFGLLAFLLPFLWAFRAEAPRLTINAEPNQGGVVWIAINVNANPVQQADAHLLSFSNHRHFLIDVGAHGPLLLPSLRKHGIEKLEAVFITHGHIDHYGGLRNLISSEVKVEKIYFNIPDKAICDMEIPWGCNYADIQKLVRQISREGIPLFSIRAGDVPIVDGINKLEVLAAFTNGINGKGGIKLYEPQNANDMSVVMRLTAENRRVLFIGDLGGAGGEQILKDRIDIGADILKVPHHGWIGSLSDEFLRSVFPKWMIVPAPLPLWNSDRCQRIKDFARLNRISIFVNGVDGEIRVNFQKDFLSIESENGGRAVFPAVFPNGGAEQQKIAMAP